MSDFTHFDEHGHARMVDVSVKAETVRIATAEAEIRMRPETLQAVLEGTVKKGDVLQVARLAGIMGAKKTWDLIPLTHPLPLDSVTVDLQPDTERDRIVIRATVKVSSRTGVEMEALTAVACAGLTVYDMCKALDREMVLSEIKLLEKSGGRSGHFVRKSSTEECF
jgi:cyclic pyranopterin phosphate synthase